MNALYSAKELLGLAMTVLPGTERSIARRADQENWSFTWQTVQGGQRKMYRAHILPEYVRKAILAKEEIDTLLPVAPQARPQGVAMSENQAQKAMYKADLLRLYMQASVNAEWGKKDRAREDFTTAYNSGMAWPELYKQLGPLHWKTIEGWKLKIKKNDNDTFLLVDRRGSHRKGACGLTETQTDILLRCALHPNKPRIAEAIRMAHSIMRTKGIGNGHSEATYRRWLQGWTTRNYHIWIFHREGAKAWNDKCAMYIERDYNLINVGDIIVADGHNLNFEIINPFTGKPQNHMTLILFYDMKSNMPLGWEIMPTENTQSISVALRRAIIRLGKTPKVVYLDNGRAFKAKFFQGSPSFDEAGYAGLYERLGCQTIFAWPYHGQSKTIERFFGSLSELERMCPTYTGTSIENKPPRMMRGEKLHRAVHEKAFGNRCLTLAEAHLLIAAWFDAYADRPQRGHLDGTCPAEIFMEGRGPGVDKAELNWLMMSIEIKTLHRNGLTFAGKHYYHPALYGRREKVTIRFDLQDTSSVYVYDQAGVFLCEAMPMLKLHPAATQLGTEAEKEDLRLIIEHKKHQEKEASGSARAFLRDEIMPEHRRQMAQLGVMLEGGEERKQLPAPVVKLDEAKLAREVAENARYQKEADERNFRDGLLNMNNSDRYEALLELEAKGVDLAEEWLGFMAFFPSTSDYTNHEEYWEQRRMAFAIMYRGACTQK